MRIFTKLTDQDGARELVYDTSANWWTLYNHEKELTVVANKSLLDALNNLYTPEYMKLAELAFLSAFTASLVLVGVIV